MIQQKTTPILATGAPTPEESQMNPAIENRKKMLAAAMARQSNSVTKRKKQMQAMNPMQSNPLMSANPMAPPAQQMSTWK